MEKCASAHSKAFFRHNFSYTERTLCTLLQIVKRNYFVALFNGHALLTKTASRSNRIHLLFKFFLALSQIRKKRNVLMSQIGSPEVEKKNHVSFNVFRMGKLSIQKTKNIQKTIDMQNFLFRNGKQTRIVFQGTIGNTFSIIETGVLSQEARLFFERSASQGTRSETSLAHPLGFSGHYLRTSCPPIFSIPV